MTTIKFSGVGFAVASLLSFTSVNASEMPNGGSSSHVVTPGQNRPDKSAAWSDVAKGQFRERGDVSVKSSYETLVMEWNAEEIYKNWNVGGFKLVSENGVNKLSSGNYPAGAYMYAQSNEIDLPKVGNGEMLFIQLDHSVEVETYYDEVSVYVQTNGGTSSYKVYGFSGKLKNGVETSFDISKYAGQKVRLSLVLNADETIAGKGWNISSFGILKGAKSSNPSNNNSLRAEDVTGKFNLRNIVVNADGSGSADVMFPDEATFYSYKARQSELTMTVNGYPVGNLQFHKESDMDDVNIVYAIDNSGSMSTYQENVRSSVRELIEYSRKLFNSNATLFRFGQGHEGCSVNEGNKFGVTTFNLSDDNVYQDFCGENNDNSIWHRNVQNGSVEQYYAVLKHVATTPFQKVEDKLSAVVLMGDEPMFSGDRNNGDCDGGTSGFSPDDQEELANFLKDNNLVVFVIQESGNKHEYSTITEVTGGDFIDISSSDYNEIADKIGKRLINRYRVTFDADKYECGQTVIVAAQWGDATSTETADVKGKVSVKRDTDTELLGDVETNTPVTLKFLVDQDDNCKIVKEAAIRYVHNGVEEYVVATEDNGLEIVDGMFSFTIPADHVEGEKILYNVSLRIPENSVTINNPYVTHSSWAWELGIQNDRPVFEGPELDNYQTCTDKTMTVKITDNDGIASAKLYCKSTLDDAYGSPITMEVDANGDFTASLDKDLGDENGFYYYIVAVDNRGLEANYGEASEPKFMKFEKIKASENTTGGELTFIRSRKCAPLKDGVKGKFSFYGKNECDSDVLLSEISVVGTADNEPYSFDLPLQDATIGKNGFSLGEEVKVKFSYDDEDRVYDLQSDVTVSEDMNLQVCIPEVIDDFTMVYLGISSLRSANVGDVVKYGDIIDLGKVAEPVAVRFAIPNSHYSPIVVNNILIDDNIGCFELDGNIENSLIQPDKTRMFDIIYKPIGDKMSKVMIYNNTKKQNPFIFYIKAEVDKKALCKKLCPSVSIYDNNFVAQINTVKHESEVTLAVMDRSGDTINYTSMIMGGPATQSLSLSTANMDKNKEYLLYVKVDEYACDNAFIFNEKSTEQFDPTADDNCNELIKNISVNSWGTMVGVPVFESTETMQLEVYTLSGSKTDVSFGPQLMGGPTIHNVYLNTNLLPEGAYILKAKVGEKRCSQVFVNVK